jgi:hypothetical protein
LVRNHKYFSIELVKFVVPCLVKKAMKISTTAKTPTKSIAPAEEPAEREVTDLQDECDLENSLTDWNAEQNQSGRHK